MRDWWEDHFLVLELAVAVAICAGAAAWSEIADRARFVTGISVDVRITLYGTIATLLGALLGFVITASSIVLVYWRNEKLAVVQRSQKADEVWKVFRSAIGALGLSTVIALMALVLERKDGPTNLMLYANAFGLTLSTFRMARVVWVLDYIVRIVTSPDKPSEIT